MHPHLGLVAYCTNLCPTAINVGYHQGARILTSRIPSVVLHQIYLYVWCVLSHWENVFTGIHLKLVVSNENRNYHLKIGGQTLAADTVAYYPYLA